MGDNKMAEMVCSADAGTGAWLEEDEGSLERLLQKTQALADELAARPNLGMQAAPLREFERLRDIGLLTAPLPQSAGGLGLGTKPGSQRLMLRILAEVGGADLALGRLYEGHVNGLLLVAQYGTSRQVQGLAEDCRAGMLSGVWNTGGQELLRLRPEESGAYQYEGVKTFATGAAFVRRPIVTAEVPGQGWQMTLPRMEVLDAKIDRSFWHPIGMESSESFGIDFTGVRIKTADLVGKPGDFYRDPLFRGGAIRFAAVQAGAVIRLHRLFADWLKRVKRAEDAYQVARLGEIALLAQEAALWVEGAADVAETCLFQADQVRSEKMVQCANMTRLAISRIATRTMQLVTEGVGARGLLQPERFERVIRDLTMYLRQPAPDQTLADVGKGSLLREGDFWTSGAVEQSLTPEYFRKVYERNSDPWNFQTSEYEAAKYKATMESLPRERYGRTMEVGCSIGVLTEKLAGRCDSVLGLDVSELALEQARARLGQEPTVEFLLMQVPKEIPQGSFDLIVISEVAYYWRMADLAKAADQMAAMQDAGGHLLLVHWTPRVHDYPLTGDMVHDYWTSRREWRTVRSSRQEKFRLNVLERVS